MGLPGLSPRGATGVCRCALLCTFRTAGANVKLLNRGQLIGGGKGVFWLGLVLFVLLFACLNQDSQDYRISKISAWQIELSINRYRETLDRNFGVAFSNPGECQKGIHTVDLEIL